MSLNALLSRARPYAPLAVILAAVAAGFARGLGLALLVLAGGMLVLAIALVWDSVQSLGEDTELTLDEALALAAPTAEEEQKRAVLRALKDLDYERGVGKVSEEDYLKLSAHYRAEAKRLLQQLDEQQSPARARVEKLVAQYVSEKVGSAPDEDDDEPAAAPPAAEASADEDEDDAPEDESTAAPHDADEDDADEDDADEDGADEDGADEDGADEDGADEDDADEDGASTPAAKTCAGCDTANDADARFCKGCGEALK